jgi:hypothetical protein
MDRLQNNAHIRETGPAVNTFRVRFRFRSRNALQVETNEYHFDIGNQRVVLSAPLPEQKISESDWAVINSRGFATKDQARSFGQRLKFACEVSAAATRLGVNSGTDSPSSGFGQTIKERFKAEHGLTLRDNVHGIDIFIDDPNVRIGNFSATATVHTPPNPFLSDLSSLVPGADVSQRTRDVIMLLNTALMRPEPVAQIIFAVSAVEMLGQDATWSADQRHILERLSEYTRQLDIGSEEERDEVADAIKKSLHRLSLRQGVFRLLDTVGLSELKKPWDALYSERSTLVHGLAPDPAADYNDLAHRTVSLCGRILLRVADVEMPGAARHIETYYALPFS